MPVGFWSSAVSNGVSRLRCAVFQPFLEMLDVGHQLAKHVFPIQPRFVSHCPTNRYYRYAQLVGSGHVTLGLSLGVNGHRVFLREGPVRQGAGLLIFVILFIVERVKVGQCPP